MRSILLVGGAPRVRVDAVRFLHAAASGTTAVALRELLAGRRVVADLLLATDAAPGIAALRYADRDDLERGLATWIAAHRDGVVVMSAAVNDYDVAAVETCEDGATRAWQRDAKVPSGRDEVVIRLRPASKLIDQLRPRFGLRGPLVGFKFQERESVVEAAIHLRTRVDAAIVVANSLCGRIQGLVDAQGVELFPDRDSVLAALAARLERL